jgi:hypothetical protein
MCMEHKLSETLEGVNQHARLCAVPRLQFRREDT